MLYFSFSVATQKKEARIPLLGAGDAGDDVLNGGSGGDTIAAGPGNDIIDVGPAGADDFAAGGPGSDTILYNGEEICSEPCIPDDTELNHRHPSCVVTDCVYTGGTATCIVTGVIGCAAADAPSSGVPAAADEEAGTAPGCDEDLIFTCCQGRSLGTCTAVGECLVPLEWETECSVADEKNAIAPGSVAEEAPEISGGSSDEYSGRVIGGSVALLAAVIVQMV